MPDIKGVGFFFLLSIDAREDKNVEGGVGGESQERESLYVVVFIVVF